MTEVQKGKITLGLITSWALGGLFLLVGALFLFNAEYGAGFSLPCLFIAALLLPPIRGFIHKKTGRSLSTGLRIVLVIVAFAVATSAMPPTATDTTATGYTPDAPSPVVAASASETSAAPETAVASPPQAPQTVATKTKAPAQKGLVVEGFSMQTDAYGMGKIVGTVRNNTKKQYSYAQVEFNLYDDSGAQVGSTIANVNNLEPGGTWAFEAPVLEARATQAKLKGISSF